MYRFRSAFLLVPALLVMTATVAFAQTDTFSDPNADYTFTLPDPQWKMTAAPSATNPNVKYVFNDPINGLLEVRRTAASKDTLLTDIVRDEEQKLGFLPGYVAGKEESFSGKHRGVAFNYEYVRAGKAMAGRFYFLRTNDTSVYVLRFTGLKDSMRSIRNQTDSIARTFVVR